jgi:hypothetical protein
MPGGVGGDQSAMLVAPIPITPKVVTHSKAFFVNLPVYLHLKQF